MEKPKHEHEAVAEGLRHFDDAIRADPGQGPYAVDRRTKETQGAGTDWCPECRMIHPAHDRTKNAIGKLMG